MKQTPFLECVTANPTANNWRERQRRFQHFSTAKRKGNDDVYEGQEETENPLGCGSVKRKVPFCMMRFDSEIRIAL